MNKWIEDVRTEIELYPVHVRVICMELLEQDLKKTVLESSLTCSIRCIFIAFQIMESSCILHASHQQENHEIGANIGEKKRGGGREGGHWGSFFLLPLFVLTGRHEYALPMCQTSCSPKILTVDSLSPYTLAGLSNASLAALWLCERVPSGLELACICPMWSTGRTSLWPAICRQGLQAFPQT